jgi:hypothetical protein
MNSEVFRQHKVSSEVDLLEFEQIIVGDKTGPKGTNFGLLQGGKK